ncbi:hypothetical protein [Mesorhizobium argentiipisi]|uniref:Uncharacterized protein n=1 Tax=Mesorhizobium argentiipisi TaxID=3015175 RepID=A0ABU8KE81_9HYPH
MAPPTNVFEADHVKMKSSVLVAAVVAMWAAAVDVFDIDVG